MTESTTKSNKTIVPSYDSNPFTLTFNSFSRFFKTNAGWAIAILVLSFFGYVGQLANNFGQMAVHDRGQSSMYTHHASTATAPVATTPTNLALIAIIVLIALILVTLVIVGATAVGVFISGMFSYVAIQSETGKKVGFSEAWEQTAKRFWRLFKAQLLAGLKIFGWTLLFIIPGIIAALRYTLLPFVIMGDSATEKGARSAHSSTKALVKGRLLEVFGIATVASIVPFVGQILGLTGNAALYQQLQAYHHAKLEKPKVHWLNYLGFMIMGVVLLLIILVVAILAVAYTKS